VLAAAVGLWLASGTQREKPVIAETKSDTVRVLEADVAAHPGDASRVQALVQAYLDAKQPGLAVALVESAPGNVRDDVRVDHLYARALVDEGRNQDALMAERRVLGACRSVMDENPSAPAGCDHTLFASATRRAAILQELVKLGVEDSQAEPEASLVAYHNAIREAHVSAQ
jgi:hypothetical protein